MKLSQRNKILIMCGNRNRNFVTYINLAVASRFHGLGLHLSTSTCVHVYPRPRRGPRLLIYPKTKIFPIIFFPACQEVQNSFRSCNGALLKCSIRDVLALLFTSSGGRDTRRWINVSLPSAEKERLAVVRDFDVNSAIVHAKEPMSARTATGFWVNICQNYKGFFGGRPQAF